MHEYARLEFHRSKWHLLTGDKRDRARTWTDRAMALSTPAEEGWTISGPDPAKKFCLIGEAAILAARLNSRMVDLGKISQRQSQREQ